MAQQRQVNVRLDDSDFEELEAAAFIRRRSVPDELRAAVLEHLAKLRDDPRMQQAQRLRDDPPTTNSDRRKDEGVVMPFNSKRKPNA